MPGLSSSSSPVPWRSPRLCIVATVARALAPVFAERPMPAKPHARPNPSLHPTCYRGLRPLPQAGGLKR